MLFQRVTSQSDRAATVSRALGARYVAFFVVSGLVSSAALAAGSAATLDGTAKSGSVDTLMIGTPGAGTTLGEVSIPVTLNVHGLKPSLIVFKMVFDTDVLTFKTVARGEAATAAGKYAEAYEAAPGTVGFIVWALNTGVMDTGLVLTATFELVAPQTPLSQVFISGVNASMADEIGNPVAVRMIYFAPAAVTVSPDPEGALVQWSEVPGAESYLVYQSESEDPTSADRISDTLSSSELSYVDDSVPTDPQDPDYCHLFYYWVAAENANNDEGTLSEPAAWNPGGPAAPETVAVSSINSAGALIDWLGVDGAAGYQVYRGSSDNPSEAESISEWLPAADGSYLDNQVVRGTCALGCAETCQTYYYWVRARSESECEGTFSSVAVGRGLQLISGKERPSAASVMPAGFGLGHEALGDLLLLLFMGGGLLTARRFTSFRRDRE